MKDYLPGKYPNAAAFTPYAGIGLGFFNGDFDETADWSKKQSELFYLRYSRILK